MTENEWRIRRQLPAVRASVRAGSQYTTTYIATVVWLALCVACWSLLAFLFWDWFATQRAGFSPINWLQAIGMALVAWVFREMIFGSTRLPDTRGVVNHMILLSAVLAAGWMVHLCFVAMA